MIQTCAIPGCRLRGRHEPGCDGQDCAGCLPRTTDNGWCCDVCVGRAAARLETLTELTPDARLVAAGLVRRGHGHSTGKPGSQSPMNDGATDAMDEITNAITTIAQNIADTRGLQIASADTMHPDPLIRACSWLLGQMDWVRHATDNQGQPYAIAAFSDLGENAARIRSLLDGPAAQRYLGPCGNEIPIGTLSQPDLTYACDGDIYGRVGAAKGTCRTCGAHVDQDQRRAWLDEQVGGSDLAWTARGIADALNLNVKTVRAWATPHTSDTGTILRPAKLATYYRLGEHIVPWTEPEEGEDAKARGDRLHYVGDVRRLAQESADRREAERQRRDTGAVS